ncbi:Adenosinetriphosphatase [Desulfotomaculum nigrificans CO-1-SRB]|uniref:Adenosinetriphosphatase n=1 Tax=Desulfotomaculum nigrificans (strain DSM 14880 / VKM B-2319 / CO-1-SRB) TaxID=868595 RepID=F6B5Z2_DESCC|nr:AAA family ATPase [Desulfotomaculum nigrificans]AEF94311.1 Adenosinetriphosphatase [Desulfotomaculum nigrificans CO-1-SRB]
MLKEISLGLGVAMLIFAISAGYDVTPIIFLLAFGGGLFYMASAKGMVKGFTNDSGQPKRQEISFDDIGGQGSAIKELKEALDFIKNESEIKRLGIRPLKGILMTGPPGTGKTLMARAAANYTDAVFVSASGSDFVEMYAGVGAQRVRKIFQTARDTAKKQKKRNAIIFIDEIEVLAAKRGQNSSHMEYDQTLNALLVEMDGLKVDDSVRILIMAATNRVDIMDPALLRPGRFDRQVKVDLPDKAGRLEILKIHTRNKPLAADVDLNQLARESFGFSGAHLESLANEAAILAMREGLKEIHYRHFHEAVDKVIMGEKLERQPNQEELKRVAIHETGHALISELARAGSVSTLTVTPRGGALGYMRQNPEDDTYLYTKEYLENQIAIMLAGAAAEEVVLGNRSTGASNDYEKALHTAETIIKSGLSELGVVNIDNLPGDLRHRTVSDIIKKQEQKVLAYLQEHKGLLNSVVAILLEKEKISGDEFRSLINKEIAV